MRNASVAFGFLSENSTRASHQFLVFQTPSKLSTKGIRVSYVDVLTLPGIRVRYAEFIISLSILKGSVYMNQNRLEKKRNESPAFGFLTHSPSLGELFI